MKDICFGIKSMVSYRAVYKNLKYFENIASNWSKLGSLVDKRHMLHVIDLILDKLGKRICNSEFSFLLMPLVYSIGH